MPNCVPFVTFSGYLKQLETDFLLPIMGKFFDPCFSTFRDLDELYAKLNQDGISFIVSAAGIEENFWFRARRFAGGPGIPSGRYFTICSDDKFNDGGTLHDELINYYNGESGIDVMILDPKIEGQFVKHLFKACDLRGENNFYCFRYRIVRRTEKNAALLKRKERFSLGQNIAITYGVRQIKAKINGIIDLRDPDTQAWFTETFAARFCDFTAIVFSQGQANPIRNRDKRYTSFGDLLPSIVGLETGGGMAITQAIGRCLRQLGAGGLIFPSARSNAFNMVRDGRVVASRGWNLVLYSDAAAPDEETQLSQVASWGGDPDHDHIHVNYTADGRERGSFSIRGVREFNLVRYDLRKQIAHGIRGGANSGDMSGVVNKNISTIVNRMLEEERKHQSIWYGELDYVLFVKSLEDEWAKAVSSRRKKRPT